MIYFIRDESTQRIKIGFTAGNGKDRLDDLQTGCPGQLMLLLQMEGSRELETAWHERFAGARERGEWFRPVPELLQGIDEAKALLEENRRQIIQKLKKEQEEFERSGGRGWTSEEIRYLRVLQLKEEREEEQRRLDEERRKITAGVAKVRELLDALGAVIAFRKLHSVLNALEVQVDDGNYQRQAVARLFEALLATAELYDIPKFRAKELAEAASYSLRDIRDT